MKETDFWQQVSVRNRENRKITRGGVSPSLAPLAASAGLHFWKIGLLLALVLTVWVWFSHYLNMMRLIRILIWR
jgi:hypothetical protein